MDLKLTGYKKDIVRDVLQDLQMKPAEVLIFKRIHTNNKSEKWLGYMDLT